MVEALILALGSGLSIWDHAEKSKYADQLMRLKEAWYEESNRPDAERSDAALDSIEHELCVLSLSFASAVTVPHA